MWVDCTLTLWNSQHQFFSHWLWSNDSGYSHRRSMERFCCWTLGACTPSLSRFNWCSSLRRHPCCRCHIHTSGCVRGRSVGSDLWGKSAGDSDPRQWLFLVLQRSGFQVRETTTHGQCCWRIRIQIYNRYYETNNGIDWWWCKKHSSLSKRWSAGHLVEPRKTQSFAQPYIQVDIIHRGGANSRIVVFDWYKRKGCACT